MIIPGAIIAASAVCTAVPALLQREEAMHNVPAPYIEAQKFIVVSVCALVPSPMSPLMAVAGVGSIVWFLAHGNHKPDDLEWRRHTYVGGGHGAMGHGR